MASFYLCPFASFLQVLNDNGQVQPGLLAWTYLAGTSTPTATYTDISGATPNSNPIQLNAAGRLPNVSVWQPGGTAIKVQFSTNAGTVGSPVFGVQVGPTFDQISGINDPAATLATLANAGTGFGADLVSNAMRSYDLIASVRAANVPALSAGETLAIQIEGGTTVNDGAGGLFYWSASSTATDDGISVIKPTAAGSTGRYVRLLSSASGSFTGSWSQFTVTQTATVNWTLTGSLVTLVIPQVTGTASGSGSQYMTGIPSLIAATRTQGLGIYGGGVNNGAAVGVIPVMLTNTIGYNFVAAGSWTVTANGGWAISGGQTLPVMTITYRLL